jgi:hypothetical protein
VEDDLRKLEVRIGGWSTRTGNRGRRFYGKPRLIMGCRADDDDDD